VIFKLKFGRFSRRRDSANHQITQSPDHQIQTAFLAATVLAACTLSACDGLFTAPASDLPPLVASETADFVLKGFVVDEQGQPIEGVLLTQDLYRHRRPTASIASSDDHRLRRVDGKFEVKERGHDLRLTFSREGYHDLNCFFNAASPNLIKTPYGIWSNEKNFPIVMLQRNRRPIDLETACINIDCSDYPRTSAIVLQRLADQYAFPVVSADVSPPNSLPPGCLYITLTPSVPKPINDKGDLDPRDVNLPENLTIHISGQSDNGLIRIPPRFGYPPLQASNTAPEGPYLSELTFDKKRLKQLRDADGTTVPEIAEYFFFRAGNHYGKGSFSWTHRLQSSSEPQSAAFEFQLWLQKAPNDRNVCTHH